jgi:hypothetical protein
MKKIIIFLFPFLFLCLLFSSCLEEQISTNPSHKLSFSTDTLSFDTIFSSVGSTTLSFMVYNRTNEALKIQQIKLAGGDASPFKINVDGVSSSSLQNVEIKAKDSLFIFVQVTIDPKNQNLPFLVKDSITFYTNTNFQNVKLIAYGQDAFIFKSKTIHSDSTLKAEKPYLIYGNLQVDSGKTLTIQKNSKLYFHNKANLIVKGNLIVNGTLQNPVIFRGDRLDLLTDKTKYDDLSGQWGGIQLLSSKGNHLINYANIRNGVTGIQISGNSQSTPKLLIENSIITNFDSCGISARQANVTIENSLISNCGVYCLKLLGGTNSVLQTTIANYFFNISVAYYRSTPSVLIENYELNNVGAKIDYPLLQANFWNTIIYGSLQNELELDSDPSNSTTFNYSFNYSLIRMTQVTGNFNQITWNVFPNFISTQSPFNYNIDSLSVARNIGSMTIANQYPLDLNGNSRYSPDLGAYEYVSK